MEGGREGGRERRREGGRERSHPLYHLLRCCSQDYYNNIIITYCGRKNSSFHLSCISEFCTKEAQDSSSTAKVKYYLKQLSTQINKQTLQINKKVDTLFLMLSFPSSMALR